MAGLGGEQIAQEGDGVGGVGVGFEVVRVVAGLDGFEVTAFAVLGLVVAGDADGEIRATVEGILGVDKGDRERVIFGDGDAEELASAAVSEAVARVRDRQTILNLDKWREATAGSWLCDAARARAELGLACAPTSERLAETAAAYRAVGWL